MTIIKRNRLRDTLSSQIAERVGREAETSQNAECVRDGCACQNCGTRAYEDAARQEFSVLRQRRLGVPALRRMLEATLIAALIACTVACTMSAPTAVPRDAACHEQADAWCPRAGFGAAPGCWVWYVHECEPAGPDGMVDAAAQDACLDAIASTEQPDVEPPACVQSWGTT